MSEETPDSLQGIAIVGLSGRFPGAPSLEAFWRNLREGVEAVSFFTEDELREAGVDPAVLADPLYVRARGELPGYDLFDAAFFGFTPREAEILDPQHRLFLECAWEALENAGYDTERFGGRVAVFGGTGMNGYLFNNLLPNEELLDKVGIFQTVLMNEVDFLTTRVSYKLNLKGPSVLVQTACSTALVAIHMGCQSLLAGESDMALAGGVSVDVPQKTGYLYEDAGVASPDGHCRAFDAAAAGTVNGSGVGIVVLKRLEDALADGDLVHAVIRGSAINNDGSGKVGFTAPSVEGQSEVIAESLLMAGVEPDSIGYVEAHGSGTALGDPIEVAALTQAFRAGTDRTGFCALGSVKTSVGHCNAAAGVAGLIKTVLALEHGEIPPSLHYETPNPRIDFAESPFFVNTRLRPWPGDGPRRAGVSSFGLGGTNAHVVLEEAPPREAGEPSRRPVQLLPVSARTATALETAAAGLAARLASEPGLDLADVAYTLGVGRRGFEHRRAVVAGTAEEAAAALADPRRILSGVRQGTAARPVVFLFPGLGDQYVDMARELYDTEPVFREQVDLSAGLLEPLLGVDLRQVIFSGEGAAPKPAGQGPDLRAMLRREPTPRDAAAARLARTDMAQPAHFVVEHALARLLFSWGIVPEAMIGYSIGEYVAACLAGVLSLEDALFLVASRAKLIQELPAGAMLAVPLPEEEIRPLLGERLSVSATNGPHFCVVGGSPEDVDELADRLTGRGVSTIRLQTSHAFHSAMMEPAVSAFTGIARRAMVNPPSIPYLSNVTGTWVTPDDLADPGYWARHMRQTVRFAEGVAELLKSPGRLFLEVGPGGTLGTLVKQHPEAPAGLVTASALRSASEGSSDTGHLLEAVGRLWAAGAEVDWKGFWGEERRLRVELPTYPFERQRCWVEPPRGASLSRAARALTGGAGEPAGPAGIADRFWVPVWKQAPRVGPAGRAGGSWLLVLDREGLGERLAERLRGEGVEVATVAPGEGFGILSGRELPSRIVHLGSLTREELPFDAALESGLASLVLLEQALAAGEGSSPVRIAVVGNRLQEVLDGDTVEPAKAAVLGAVKVIHQEAPRLTCGALDIVLPEPGSPAEERLIGQILAEMGEEEPRPVVAYRGRQRFVRSFERVRIEAGDPAASPLRDAGVYLVTDGVHGMGPALAEHLVHGLAAKVALGVPPDFPTREQWEGWPRVPAGQDPIGGTVRRLLALERAGELDRVLLVRQDVSAPGGMRALLERCRERFGRIDGVFHAGGSWTGGLLQLKTPETLAAALEPLVRGTGELFAALEEGESPAFVALSASTITVAGGLGQLDIAATGAFLDALAQRRAAAGGAPTIAIHWDPYQWEGWLAGGVGAGMIPGLPAGQLDQDLAAHSVPSAESAEALRRLLASGLGQAIVSAGDLEALIAETDAFTTEVFLEQMKKAPRSEPHRRSGLSTPYAPPGSELEEKVAALWQELFGIDAIGVEDNFLELGGHSLLAIQMMTRVRTLFGVDLPVTALFEAPTVSQLAAAVAREQAGEKETDGPRAHQPPPVPRRTGPTAEGDWPLSPDQERLWFLHQLDPENSAYNVDAASRLRGPLDLATIEACLQEIVRRHAAWRATFPTVAGRPVQRVLPERRQLLSLIDLAGLPEGMRGAETDRVLYEGTRGLFDLEAGPLVRTCLVELAPEDHICLLVIHHLATDWVTFQHFFGELALLYEASRAGRPSPLPEPPLQYPDYVLWQREWMRDEVLHDYVDWWVERLRGFPQVLELPTDRPRPPVETGNGDRWMIHSGRDRAERLRSFARREGVTPFILVLALWDVLFQKLSGQDRIVLGTNTANRARPELETVFGYFLTQLPFPIDLAGDPTFREALSRVRKSALEAYAHQELPFGRLVEVINPERDASVMPLVQAIVLVLDAHYHKAEVAGLSFEPVDVFDAHARFDLMIGVYDYDEGLVGPLEFNADLYDAPTIGRWVELFYLLIDAITADPERRLSDLPAFSEAARHQVLAEWNDTGTVYPRGRLHDFLAAQAERSPEAVAVVYAGESLTYRELDLRANRLAHRLIAAGCGPDVPVGILMERSLELMVGLLATLKAGGAYLPLDPELPGERLGWMVPGVPLILAQEHLLDRLPPCAARVLPLPPGAPGEPDERADAPADRASEESLAYILYTSGSTGRPKGVMIPHRGIVNRLLWMQEAYGLTPDDRVLQKTPVSFDVSVWELFWPLMFGARLVFAQPGGHRDSAYLRHLVEREAITVLHFVPSMLQVFLEERDLSRCTTPRLVVCSGEALPPDLRARCLERLPARLENLYGPTEASVDVTRWPCDEARRVVPIGRPIANLRIHLLDRDLRPAPLGATGEVWIGGAGLARGYLGRPDLTADRFRPDPLSTAPGGRLYRTGDLGRLLPDGAIDFLGRTDHQVKLRGHRIELGEIEAALRLHEEVADAAVLLKEERADARLAAFVVPRGEAAPRPADLRAFLEDRLPRVMVPSAWGLLPGLPLTPSGKVDRRALAGMETLSLGAGERIAPRTPEEGVLAAIWSRVLGVREAGIADDFFALGGHSLLATQLVVEIREAFGVDLPVRAIFRAPTIAAQAEAVALARARGDGSRAPGPILPVSREGELPLSFAQERLWFLDRLTPGSSAYNLPLALRVRGELDLSALARAMAQVVERHEALRTTFATREGRPFQVVAPADGWSLPVRDLADSPDPEAEARRLASAETVRPFDLERGPVLRTELLRLAPGEHVLLLTVHHIAADLWALGVLVRDLETFYAAGATGRPAGLPDLPVQYADFAVWQRGWLQGESLERQLAYWRERLAGAPPVLDLPTDRPRPPVQSFRGASLSFSAGPELAAALADLGRRQGATLFMTLTAALAVLLGRLSGQEDVVLGAPIANRQRPELAGLVGMFVNTLAVRVPLAGNPGFAGLTDRVRSLTLDDFAHQDVPFEKLVEELETRRDLSRHPLFQAALAFQNVPLGRLEVPGGLTLEPLETGSAATKFDLTFTLEETGGDLAGVVEYATDLFDEATVRRVTGHLRTLLAGAVAAPETPVSDLPLLSAEERGQILVEWNRTSSDYPREATLHGLFRERAERTPGAVALVHGETEVTYGELAWRAERLARRLRGLGVGPETRVGLATERTPGRIAGMLAILEAGGAYLPLDPGDPGERLAFLLEDAGAPLALVERSLLAALPGLPAGGPRVVCLEDLEEAPEAGAPLTSAVTAGSLAYVMYTSGSTGAPKGVAVTHGNVVRLVRGGGFADLGPGQTWLHLAPASFDAATLEIWAPLLNGGRLVLFPGQRASLDELAEAIARHGVTSLWLTAGLFHQMVDHRLEGLRPLSQLLAGGDVLSPSHVRRVLESLPGTVLVNGYGPTEGTTFTACHPMTRPEEAVTSHGSVPVGTPIAGTRVHILDRELQPVPPGVTGELFAGGDGLARGYLGRPDLTAERFVPDPFAGTGERLYRTGDLARYLPDGRIEFLGRGDDQVKIRGFRVEPGEVEAALAEHPSVLQAAVLVRRHADGGKGLLACVVPVEREERADLPARLERALRTRLPEPLIPSSWAVLDSLPLTANGKVDRRALEARVGEGEGSARTRPPYAPPRTPLEERLAATTAQVLGLADERSVGIHDNFFALGGHSLLATQLVARLADRWGIEVPLQELFEAADLADLAERVTARELQAVDGEELREMLEDLDGLSPEDLKALLETEGGAR